MKHRIVVLASLTLLGACAETATGPQTAVQAPSSLATVALTLNNPSFEVPYTGWAYSDVDMGPYWTATDGLNSVDLNGFHAGYISQALATVPGVTYTVVFDLAGNPGYPQNVKELQVSAGATSALYYFDTTGKSVTNMGWTTQSFSFTATAATTTLTFQSLHTGNPYIWQDQAQGAAVDNVRVTYEGQNNPTTADQCKNGGWVQYGFRNQGLCIQFVNTGKDSR
jgi:choice-of-anchor C domain-containing protein